MKIEKEIYVIATKDTPRKFQQNGEVFTDDISMASYFWDKEYAQAHLEFLLNPKQHFVLPVNITYEYKEFEVV